MDVPQLSGELARRMYPVPTPGNQRNLVDLLMRAAITAELVGRHGVAAQRSAEAKGFLDLRTSQGPKVVEYLQFGNVPDGTTRETVLGYIDDVLEGQGFSGLDDRTFDPSVLYQKGDRVFRVEVTLAPRRRYLFVTVSDATELYALRRDTASAPQG